jgi:EAL domain-containing protein (putative c-di-GMP-specific phosphodiesterase class I)
MPLTAEGLSDADCAKALLYTINAFAKGKRDFTVSDLMHGYRQMRGETIRRVRSHRKIITGGAFDVLFQPIVDLGDRSVHHYEALMRLRKKGKAASPFEFITFAEDVGIINEFDLAMCRKVIGKIESAAAMGDKLFVAVNLSGRSLGTDGFVDALFDLLKGSPHVGGRLIFEVTESSTITDLPAVNRVLAVLRTAGHAVCLDDFGAGATAYQYLRELEVDFVKIDGAYVRDALTTPNGKAFLRSMTTLCKELKIDTIGEMVETEAEATFLLEAGVDYGQGYLFGRPSAGLSAQPRRAAVS